MTYQIEISRGALKQLKKLSADIREKIEVKIQALAEEPLPDGVVKLKDTENGYRIRVGNYRILYQIQDYVLVVTVVKIGHRREVYRQV